MTCWKYWNWKKRNWKVDTIWVLSKSCGFQLQISAFSDISRIFCAGKMHSRGSFLTQYTCFFASDMAVEMFTVVWMTMKLFTPRGLWNNFGYPILAEQFNRRTMIFHIKLVGGVMSFFWLNCLKLKLLSVALLLLLLTTFTPLDHVNIFRKDRNIRLLTYV